MAVGEKLKADTQKGGKATKAGSKKWAGYKRESSKLKQDIMKRM